MKYKAFFLVAIKLSSSLNLISRKTKIFSEQVNISWKIFRNLLDFDEKQILFCSTWHSWKCWNYLFTARAEVSTIFLSEFCGFSTVYIQETFEVSLRLIRQV